MSEESFIYVFTLLYTPSPLGGSPIVRTIDVSISIECHYRRSGFFIFLTQPKGCLFDKAGPWSQTLLKFFFFRCLQLGFVLCFRKNDVSSDVLKPTWAPFSETKASEESLYFSLRLMTGGPLSCSHIAVTFQFLWLRTFSSFYAASFRWLAVSSFKYSVFSGRHDEVWSFSWTVSPRPSQSNCRPLCGNCGPKCGHCPSIRILGK